jgi:hypothetical protein
VVRGGHGFDGAGLRTARLSAVPSVARAEALAPGEMRRVAVGGELLGAARVRGRFAPLPLDAFDRAGRVLEPEEQGAYFQLLRLSYGEGRNFCRAARKDLMARLGASERRLNRILEGLARKRFVRLLHRDNRGTLFRVYLPREAAGEPLGDDVLLGAAANDAPAACDAVRDRSAADALARTFGPAPPPAPLRPRPRASAASPSAPLVAALAAARGIAEDVAAAEIDELLADGATPRQIEAAVRAIGRRSAKQDEGGCP